MAALLDMMEIDATPMSTSKPMIFDKRKAGSKLETWAGTDIGDGHGWQSVDEEPLPLEITDPEILKLVQSGKLQAEVHDADLRANNRDQVNLSMYTSEAMEKRRRLKESPHVIHGVYRWWLFLGGGEFNLNTGFISKQNYVEMCVLTEQVMNPAGFDAKASEEAAGQEWDSKMGADCDAMFWEDFFHEIYEMVDLWTDTCSESAYCDFLRTTLRRVEAMRAKLAEKHIKATAGLADSSIKQEMEAWDPYDQKRNTPSRPPLNATFSQGLQRAGSGYEHEAYSALDNAATASDAPAVSAPRPVLQLPDTTTIIINNNNNNNTNTNDTTTNSSSGQSPSRLAAGPVAPAPVEPLSPSRGSSLAASPSRRHMPPGHHLLSEKQRAAMVHPRLPDRHRNASPHRADPLGSPTRHAREELRRAARASSPPKPWPKPRPHSSAPLTLPLSPTITTDRKIASARIQSYIQRTSRIATPHARARVYHPLSGGPPPLHGTPVSETAPPGSVGGALAQHPRAPHPLAVRPLSLPRDFLGTPPPLDVRTMYQRQVLRAGSSRGRASSAASTLKGSSKPVSHQEVGRRIAAACIRSRVMSAARRSTPARSFPTSHRRAWPASSEQPLEAGQRASWKNSGLGRRPNIAADNARAAAAGDHTVGVSAGVETAYGWRPGGRVLGEDGHPSTVHPEIHHQEPPPLVDPKLGQGQDGYAGGMFVTLPQPLFLPSTPDPRLHDKRGSPARREAPTDLKDHPSTQTTFAPLITTPSNCRSSRSLGAKVHAHRAGDNGSTSPQHAVRRSAHSSLRHAGLAVTRSPRDEEGIEHHAMRTPSRTSLPEGTSVPMSTTTVKAETEFTKHVQNMRQHSARALGGGENCQDAGSGDTYSDGHRLLQPVGRASTEGHAQVKYNTCAWTPRSGSVCSWDPAPPVSHQYSVRGKPWDRGAFHAGNGHRRPLSAAVEDALLSSQQHGNIGKMLRIS